MAHDQADNLRRLAKQNADSRTAARVLNVASGKGGTGKTFFSVNFSIALASAGKRVMLIDADFGLSNVDVMLGTKPKYNLGHVLRGEVSLADAVSRGHGNIEYVSGGSGAETLLGMKRSDVELILDQTARLDSDYDFIIFDSGAGINDGVLKFINCCDESILMLNAEPTSVMDAFALMKCVASKTRRPPVHFVMNKAENMLEAVVMAKNFKNIVKKYLYYDMHYMGYITSDASAVKSIKRQTPVMISEPDARCARDVASIASQYLGQSDGLAGGGLQRFLERVIMSYEPN